MVDMTDMFLENCFFKIKYITCEVFFEATYMDIFQTSELTMNNFVLTLSWRKPISYRNQSIDLLSKSMDWFLYDNGLRVMKELMSVPVFCILGVIVWSAKYRNVTLP